MTRQFSEFLDLLEGFVLTTAWSQLWQVFVLVVIVGIATRLYCRNRPHLAHTLRLLVLIKCLTPPIWSSPVGGFSHIQTVSKVSDQQPEVVWDKSVDEMTDATESYVPEPSVVTPEPPNIENLPATSEQSPHHDTKSAVASTANPPSPSLIFCLWHLGRVGRSQK